MTASVKAVTGAAVAVLTPALMRQWALAAAEALAEHAQQINDLNVFPVPDADTGTNSSLTFQAGLTALEELPPDADLATIARVMGRAAAFGARGNSGVILSQMLRGILDTAVQPNTPIDATAMAQVLRSVADAGREAVADPRDGTMLSVAADAATAAQTAAQLGANLAQVCVAAADAARASLIDTPNHLAELAEAGVVDAGGRAVVVVLDALAEVVTGVVRPEWTAPVLARSCDLAALRAAYTGPAYEVMYVLSAHARDVADVQSQLVNLGDSLAVVGGDGVWNVHVHVDDPASAIAIGRAAGELHNVRVSYLLGAAAADVQLVTVGVDGELAGLAREMGAVVLDGTNPENARAQLIAEVKDAAAVLLLCLGAAAGAKPPWWRETGFDADVAVVACTHAAQVVAALAVADTSATLADMAVAMSEAAAAMNCGSVSSASAGASWSLPGWKSGVAESTAAAFTHVVTMLVTTDVEAVTVVLDTHCDLQVDDITAVIADAAAACELQVLRASVPVAGLSIGVES